jgi:site-specific DNA-methyltransferase (adenine-specific)
MDLKIEYVDIDTIKPYLNNAKLHPQEQIEQIKKSIQEFGNNDPIAVWNNEIVEGHGRYEALKQLGETNIPIIRLDNLTDEERRAYTLVHNKLTMNSDFDIDILNDELMNSFDTIDMSDFGFDLDLNIDEEKEIIEDEVPDIPEEPKAKLGDIYQLGNHRLMCGDSTKEEDVAKLMNGVKADMVFTDPPYGANMGIIGDIGEEFKIIFEGFYNCIPCEDNIYICCDWRCIDSFCQTIKQKHEIYNLIVWVKNLFGQGKLYHTKHEEIIFCGAGNYNKKNLNNDVNVWEADSVRNFGGSKNAKEAVGHPTQKPIEICARAIKNSSNENENVYDGFGGSGSTLIACEQLNRKCYMMELEPHYIDVIIQRWENFTGEKVVLLND